MPQYLVQIEMPRYQGQEANRRDHDRLQEIMSKLLFDQVVTSNQLRLPAGTFVGASVSECEDLGRRLEAEVRTVWPAPKIVLVRVKEMWSVGLKEAPPNGMLERSRSA